MTWLDSAAALYCINSHVNPFYINVVIWWVIACTSGHKMPRMHVPHLHGKNSNALTTKYDENYAATLHGWLHLHINRSCIYFQIFQIRSEDKLYSFFFAFYMSGSVWGFSILVQMWTAFSDPCLLNYVRLCAFDLLSDEWGSGWNHVILQQQLIPLTALTAGECSGLEIILKEKNHAKNVSRHAVWHLFVVVWYIMLSISMPCPIYYISTCLIYQMACSLWMFNIHMWNLTEFIHYSASQITKTPLFTARVEVITCNWVAF